MSLSHRLSFFLGALSTLCPTATVRIDGARAVAPADANVDDVDASGDVRVIVCLSPEYLGDTADTGYTPEWERIHHAVDAVSIVAGAPGSGCDDAGFEEDGSGEYWCYTLRLSV